MRGTVLSGAALCSVVLIGATPSAHHSIAAYYDGSKQTTLEAVVNRMQFINPHPFLWVDVTATNGATTSWRLEMDNRGELTRAGFTADTLRPGDRVTVRGSLGRTQPNEVYLLWLERRADGLRYEQVGGTPRLTRPGA